MGAYGTRYPTPHTHTSTTPSPSSSPSSPSPSIHLPSPSTQLHRVNQHWQHHRHHPPHNTLLLRLLQNCTPIICLPPFSQWSNTCHCSRRSWLCSCCCQSSHSSPSPIVATAASHRRCRHRPRHIHHQLSSLLSSLSQASHVRRTCCQLSHFVFIAFLRRSSSYSIIFSCHPCCRHGAAVICRHIESSVVIAVIVVVIPIPLRMHSSSKYFVFIIIILPLIQYFYLIRFITTVVVSFINSDIVILFIPVTVYSIFERTIL